MLNHQSLGRAVQALSDLEKVESVIQVQLHIRSGRQVVAAVLKHNLAIKAHHRMVAWFKFVDANQIVGRVGSDGCIDVKGVDTGRLTSTSAIFSKLIVDCGVVVVVAVVSGK